MPVYELWRDWNKAERGLELQKVGNCLCCSLFRCVFRGGGVENTPPRILKRLITGKNVGEKGNIDIYVTCFPNFGHIFIPWGRLGGMVAKKPKLDLLLQKSLRTHPPPTWFLNTPLSMFKKGGKVAFYDRRMLSVTCRRDVNCTYTGK